MDLSKYTLATYMRIVTYKTAFYSFYLPVACGLVLSGRSSSENLKTAQEICLQMGQYFQARLDLPCLQVVETKKLMRLGRPFEIQSADSVAEGSTLFCQLFEVIEYKVGPEID